MCKFPPTTYFTYVSGYASVLLYLFVPLSPSFEPYFPHLLKDNRIHILKDTVRTKWVSMKQLGRLAKGDMVGVTNHIVLLDKVFD